MQKQLKVTLLSLLGLALPAFSQAYLDGREVLSLANASRYAEAFQLARKRPEAYGQWVCPFDLAPHSSGSLRLLYCRRVPERLC